MSTTEEASPNTTLPHSDSKRPKLDCDDDKDKGETEDGQNQNDHSEVVEAKPQENGNGNGTDEKKPPEEEETEEVVEKEICPDSANTKKATFSIESNVLFSKEDGLEERTEKLHGGWQSSEDISDEAISISQQPFRHGEIKNFIKNPEFVQGFVDLFTKIEFQEKATDLYQFSQSNDLNSLVDPHVFALNEYLTTKVTAFLRKVTGLPLNDTIDMFLSIYRQTDFLLCHDDELDSRRIAFIWYLSEDWQDGYGGTLDLYSATESCHPDKIVKKVVPEFNKFVFFEVGPTSFHQVSEVVEKGKNRFALSGWIYGDPLPRPKIEFPVEKSFQVLESVQDQNGVFKKICAEMYHNAEIYSEINEQLADQSEVLVPGFFKDDVYATICKAIVEADVSADSDFHLQGPDNLAHYKETLSGPPPTTAPGQSETSDEAVSSSSSSPLESLREFFYSTEFLDFMEKITEFPFSSSTINRVTSSLQKFSHGCYSLLRSGGAKQTGIKPASDTDLSEEEEEPNLVDVMFFVANNWAEDRGGSLIYSTTEGEQLITVPPEGNCLAVVVRSAIVNSYTNYVNCLAKEDVFFVYKMTFAFDGSI